GTIEVVEYLGADMFVIVDCGFEEKVTVRLGGDTQINAGARVGLYFAPEKLQFFDAAGQTISP
ncbi:TOBE domain-containing protein, partial [Phaeobacter sp.]|uniref:TOBE domain-containing protein n=1 Tax=Phaeobacter sp. TaxID=1902409 RepID=UPI0025F1778D